MSSVDPNSNSVSVAILDSERRESSLQPPAAALFAFVRLAGPPPRAWHRSPSCGFLMQRRYLTCRIMAVGFSTSRLAASGSPWMGQLSGREPAACRLNTLVPPLVHFG